MNILWELLGSELSVFADFSFSNPWADHLRYCQIFLAERKAEASADKDLLFLYDVLDKILHRGSLTFPTYAIEKRIVKAYGGMFGIQEKPHSARGSISYTYHQQLPDAYRQFSDLVEEWGANPHDIEFDPEHPENERRLFSNLISRFGSRIVHCIYPQAELDTILPSKQAKAFLSQRADFVLVFPNGKGLVLEPGDHDDAAQALLDIQRDNAFKDKGFETLRPRNADIENESLYAEIQDRIERLGAMRYIQDPVEHSKQSVAANYLFLLPSLIARIEFVLAYFLLRKNLLQSKTLTIGIVERDLHCAEWGFLSLYDHLQRLSSLYGLGLSMPQINVRVVRNDRYKFGDLSSLRDTLAQWGCTFEDTYSEEFDDANLVLDVAIKANSLTPPLRGDYRNIAALRSCYPHNSAPRFSYLSPPRPAKIDENSARLLQTFLQDFFRKYALRPGQFPIIRNILSQKPTIGLLPTSAGKSICYQTAALLTPGTTIVVDPIVALMDDQVQGLKDYYRIDRVMAWHAGSNIKDEEAGRLLAGNTMVFLSPERLLRRNFRDAMSQLKAADIFINYAVIDEAHCVSMWGHAFRPSYLMLDRNFRKFCTYQGHRPVTVALTGTASQLVLIDLKRELNMGDSDATVVRPGTFDRPELTFNLVRCPSSHKDETLKSVFNAIANRLGVIDISREAWGIVFSYRPEELSNLLGSFVGTAGKYVSTVLASDDLNSVRYGMYSGKPPKVFSFNQKQWNEYKRRTLAAFQRGQIRMLFGNTAVSAGIDNEQLNYIVNYRMPQSLEDYYQQSGRAGRSSQSSQCYLVFSDDNPQLTQRWLDEEISEMPKRRDDLGIVSYFHHKNFPGRQVDQKGAFTVFKKIFDGEMEQDGRVLLSQIDDRTEWYISCFLMLGVLEDYEVTGTEKTTKYHLKRHSSIEEFLRNGDEEALESHLIDSLHAYLSRREPMARTDVHQAIQARRETRLSERIIGHFIEFIYDNIAYQRREAIRTMVSFCNEEDTSPEQLRARIKSYFDSSKFTEKLTGMADAPPSFEAIWKVLDQIERPDDAERLSWETRRLLDERFRPDWAAINLFTILCREKTASDSALRLLHEMVRSLRNDPRVDDTALRTFLTGYLSYLYRLDNLYGANISAEILMLVVGTLYDTYGVEYATLIQELSIPEDIRDILTLAVIVKQIKEVNDAAKYSRTDR